MRVITIVLNSLNVLTKRDHTVANVDQVSLILPTKMVAFVLVNTFLHFFLPYQFDDDFISRLSQPNVKIVKSVVVMDDVCLSRPQMK